MHGRLYRRGSILKILRLTNHGKRCIELYLSKLLLHVWRRARCLPSRRSPRR